jgi:hypothetical protein
VGLSHFSSSAPASSLLCAGVVPTSSLLGADTVPTHSSSARGQPRMLLFLRYSSLPVVPICSPAPAQACIAINNPLGRFSWAWLRGRFCISRAWLRWPSKPTNTTSCSYRAWLLGECGYQTRPWFSMVCPFPSASSGSPARRMHGKTVFPQKDFCNDPPPRGRARLRLAAL